MNRLTFLFALPFSILFACQPAVSGPSDAGAHDAATASADGSANTADGNNSAQDANNTQQDAGLSDANHGSMDAMAMDFGGYDIADFDAGMIEYDGGEEPGVICGVNVTCDQETEICCAGLSTACSANDQQCPFLTFAVPCDGPEDCVGNEGGDTCCVTGSSAADYQVSCTDSSTCADTGTKVCNSTAECPQGFLCCSAESLLNVGVDLGWCKEGGC